MEKNLTNQDDFEIKDFLTICLSRWYWFLISVVLCLCIGAAMIVTTPNEYTRSATILIKETAVRRSSNELESMLSGGGLTQQNSRLPNEIIALQSPDLMKEVVRRLGLDFNYQLKGRAKMHVIYGSTLPFKASFVNYPGTATFQVVQTGDSLWQLSHLEYFAVPGQRKATKDKGIYTVASGDTVQTEIGGIVISSVPTFTGPAPEGPVYVTHSSLASATRSFNRRLGAEALDMKNFSDVLNLTITDESTQRAEDVLNTVISVYNENWVDDRNKVAISTSMFIDDRLVAIEKELGNVDSDISSYKSKNLLPDVSAVSTMYMSQTTETTRQLQELDNQLYTTRYIRNNLNSFSSPGQLIPAPTSLSNATLATQITKYNDAVLQRNNLVESSSEQNPLVIDLDNSIQAMRVAINSSLDNQIETIQAQISNLKQTEAQVNSRLADNPNQAKYLLSVERRQKVMESLYLYLLQKREENELSQAFTAYNTRLITSPYGSSSPSSPQRSKIMLAALLLGLLIPLAVIYLIQKLSTKLRGRKDLEHLSIPFVGEIPQYYSEPTKKRFLKKKKIKDSENRIVVKHGKRDVINEAFRVLRTNVEFMSKESGHQVIGVTSFNPGSGKTFTSINLAVSLALKGKKVLVVDADLRHASASAYANNPSKGVSNYLVGEVSDYRSLIVHPDGFNDIDILPVGTIPPNPSEIIGEAQFANLVGALKQEYDYVFLDCPPIDIVADTQIISTLMDRTVFIVRAGLLDRSMIPNIETLYTEGKYNNMSLVLNGTESYRSGYSYRYGYRYGYDSYHSQDYYSSK